MSNSVNKKKKLWQDLTRANWFGEYHSFPQNAEWKGPNYPSIGEVCSPSSDAFSSKRRGRDEQRLSGEKRCAADRGQEERDGIREWAGMCVFVQKLSPHWSVVWILDNPLIYVLQMNLC